MLATGIIIFLLLSALFSGSEIAFLSANKLMIELKRKKGSRRGVIIGKFFEKPSDFLGSLLVGNNIALVVFSMLASAPLDAFLVNQLGIQSEISILLINTILLTLVILLFGEFLPKTLFRLYADEILLFLAYPLRVLYFLLAIPAWVVTRLSNGLLRYVFRTPIREADDVFTRLDLENFIKSTRTESEDDIDTELFGKALNLREIRVKECMIPRPEIEGIDITANKEEIIDAFRESNLSRLIVYEDDIDNVRGYIHHQQILQKNISIKRAIMELPFVPESMKVRDLMNSFIANRINIACVVDEYGGTAGLITLEDILEEIFGEIEDEHDQEEYVEVQINENEYLFSGRLEIAHLNEKYPELKFPMGEYHTISGYLVMTTGNIPNQGDIIELGNYQFILELVSETKIETVRVLRLPEKSIET